MVQVCGSLSRAFSRHRNSAGLGSLLQTRPKGSLSRAFSRHGNSPGLGPLCSPGRRPRWERPLPGAPSYSMANAHVPPTIPDSPERMEMEGVPWLCATGCHPLPRGGVRTQGQGSETRENLPGTFAGTLGKDALSSPRGCPAAEEQAFGLQGHGGCSREDLSEEKGGWG